MAWSGQDSAGRGGQTKQCNWDLRAEKSSELYQIVDGIVSNLNDKDYEKDEKSKNVVLNDNSIEKLEGIFSKKKLLMDGGLYDINNQRFDLKYRLVGTREQDTILEKLLNNIEEKFIFDNYINGNGRCNNIIVKVKKKNNE